MCAMFGYTLQELSGLKDSHQSLEEKLKEAKALQKITNKTDAAKERYYNKLQYIYK